MNQLEYVSPEQWDIMIKFFCKRTRMHIGLVRKYCERVHHLFPDQFEGILQRGELHDQTKWKDPEIVPYIFINAKKLLSKKDIQMNWPEELQDLLNNATEHHILNNRHHPECTCGKTENLINKTDRDDIPEEMINATNMNPLDVAEMICDWCSMAEELGTDPFDWAKMNVNVRWEFNEFQEKLIYFLLENIWSIYDKIV